MDDIETQKSSILDGSNPQFTSEREQFIQERKRKLEELEEERRVRMEQVQKLYDFQAKAVEDHFNAQERELKERLLGNIDRITKNGGASKGKESERERVGTRFLRSLRKTKENDSVMMSGSSGNSDYDKFNFTVKNENILEDLKRIHHALEAHNAEPAEDLKMEKENVLMKKRTLVIKEDQFLEGDKVELSKLGGEINLLGEILLFNDKEEEIEIQLVDGTKVRVPLVHIETKRVFLSKVPTVEVTA